jgi:hypothetical protein
MTDSETKELREKLRAAAERAQGDGLAVRFYSDDVLVVCLPADEETTGEAKREGAASSSSPRRESGDRGGESTLL